MKMSGNTILVTGGSSGIGLDLARQLLALENVVIVTGRDSEKLDSARRQLPVYSATKAAVHSFTQSLRVQLKNTHVKVFELAPPGTDTALFRGDFTEEDVKGDTPMDVATLAKHAIDGMSKDVYEIRPGLANAPKLMSRVAPQFILRQLSKSADNMLSQSKSQP